MWVSSELSKVGTLGSSILTENMVGQDVLKLGGCATLSQFRNRYPHSSLYSAVELL